MGGALPPAKGTAHTEEIVICKSKDRGSLGSPGLWLVPRRGFRKPTSLKGSIHWGVSSWKVHEGLEAKINTVPPSETSVSFTAAGGTRFPTLCLEPLPCTSVQVISPIH